MRILLIGPPASGKGTQAEWICEEYGIPRISLGGMLRKHVADRTDIGEQAQAYMDRGELVPDDIVIKMMDERLKEDDCRNGFLLDGYPRTMRQALALDENFGLDIVLHLHVGDEEVIRRMSGRRTCPGCEDVYHVVYDPPRKEGVCDKCGSNLIIREDDKEETLRKRLEVYNEETSVLISFYSEKGILGNVDASGSIKETRSKTKKVLDELGKS
ncbi:MAG: adenylate kinase [Thermoplasmata archaeon]|nr:adenylate kinase [Thermoplasmata archaeon]